MAFLAPKNDKICVSLAILAWNEELTITSALGSVYSQTLFQELAERKARAEVVVVLNGCTDSTAAKAKAFFEQQSAVSGFEHVRGRVVDLPEKGKLNAWNSYVHQHSAADAQYLILMDADIEFLNPHTLIRLVDELERNPEAHVAVDTPRKTIEFKENPTLVERLSLAASSITRSASAQLCAQLYCIRANVAREIYLPRDLGACEDGLLKALVCTNLLTEPTNPDRIRPAPGAEHAFEAYTGLGALLRNQKRQVMGQTMVHLIVDKRLSKAGKETAVGPKLRALDAEDPEWLKRDLAAHLAGIRAFWNVCPGYVITPLRRWRNFNGPRKLRRFPAALAQSVLATVGSYLAWRAMKRGATSYWPKAQRSSPAMRPLPPVPSTT